MLSTITDIRKEANEMTMYMDLVKLPPWALLHSLGFVDAGTCNCNGTFNRKYKRSEYLIYITKTRFKVKKHGNTIKAYSPIENLESYLRAALPQLFAL